LDNRHCQLKPGVIHLFQWTKDLIKLPHFGLNSWSCLKGIGEILHLRPLHHWCLNAKRVFGHYTHVSVDINLSKCIFYEISDERKATLSTLKSNMHASLILLIEQKEKEKIDHGKTFTHWASFPCQKNSPKMAS